MSFDLTNKNIQDTFQNLLQKTGSDNQLYDLKGNNIEKTRKSPKQHFNWRYTYQYNNQNNIIEIIIYEYELRLGELEEVPTSKTTFDYIYF